MTEPAPGTAPITVVHVDDDPRFLTLSRACLEAEDHRLRVLTDTDPRRQLEELDRTRPDCIVSDFDMPDMDGLEFLTAVRDRQGPVPFVLFTGGRRETVLEPQSGPAPDAFVRKGDGLETFAELARVILDRVEAGR